jgi:hypothetical protein
VLASKHAPDFPFGRDNRLLREDDALLRRYPPRPLLGLSPSMVWEPPEQHARTMEAYRRDCGRRA